MNELKNMITDASLVKKETIENDTYKKEMTKNINSINNRIKVAKERGSINTCFIADSSYEEDLKKMYRDKGYHFRATGYIGGNWQLTEEICW